LPAKVRNLHRVFLATLMMMLISVPVLGVVPVSGLSLGLPPVLASQTQRKAVILSSLESLAPMGFYDTIITNDLKQAGYQVTFMSDSAVTINFLLTQLNNYDVVIWRTNIYNYIHTTYWYVGERVNAVTQQKYASDFANGWIDSHSGTLGVDIEFFQNHYPSGSLSNLKLMLIVASNSTPIGLILVGAGVHAVIACSEVISLQFGLIDYMTGQLISYLTGGMDVLDAVYNTVSPNSNQPLRDPLDSAYAPAFWFLGDGTVTIA
jgi:hypothetical protein